MNASAYPNFRAESYSPPLDRKFRGLTIALSSPPAPSALPHLCVGIAYGLDEAFAETLGGKKPAEALVLTLISGYDVFAANILGHTVLFEDDYRHKEGFWFGHVNLRLADYARLRPESEFHLTVSMGTMLSNTLHIPRSDPKPGSRP
jgi:hypothetical protein